MISSTCVQILKQLDTFLRCQHAPVLYIILCAEQNLWTTTYFRFSKRWCLCMWCKLNTWYLLRCGRKLNQRWLVVSHGTGTLTHGGEVLYLFDSSINHDLHHVCSVSLFTFSHLTHRMRPCFSYWGQSESLNLCYLLADRSDGTERWHNGNENMS